MVIEEYNSDWPNRFLQIKQTLEPGLTKLLKIEHLGSTSIPGMCAKPVIDIIIVIEAADFELTKNELGKYGYSHEGDLGITGREAFKKDPATPHEVLDKIKHHLYVCDVSNEELRRQILFRDYLRRHESAMLEYCGIKREIVGKYGNEDRDKYVAVKAAEYTWFFEGVLLTAEREVGKPATVG